MTHWIWNDAMKEALDLERLISRVLDDEAGPQERKTLRRLERQDPEFAALAEEYAWLDREAGAAMRAALGRAALPAPGRKDPPAWRYAPLAAAACLALMLGWFGPQRQASPTGGVQTAQAGQSWFLPTTPARSVSETDESSLTRLDRPYQRHVAVDRDWIIVPGDEPGEFLVLELNKIHKVAVAIQQDF